MIRFVIVLKYFLIKLIRILYLVIGVFKNRYNFIKVMFIEIFFKGIFKFKLLFIFG